MDQCKGIQPGAEEDCYDNVVLKATERADDTILNFFKKHEEGYTFTINLYDFTSQFQKLYTDKADKRLNMDLNKIEDCINNELENGKIEKYFVNKD